MNASSFTTFFIYMLQHYGKRFYKGLYVTFKETKSATMNIFRFFFSFLFKSFVKVELSYVLTINLFTIAKNCTGK